MPEHTDSHSEDCDATVAAALPRYAFIAIDGVNGQRFLQGQLSCNLDQATASSVLPGAYCTPKGRVIASFLLWPATAERILLRLRADIVAETVATLNKYGVFSKVAVSVAADWRVLGLLGPGSREALADVFPHWPERAGALAVNGDACLLRRDEHGRVFEVWAPATAAQALLRQLQQRLGALSEQAWTAALIRNGAAEIQHATRDQFLPQMLGYDQSGAVNFRKGCYTGQEIVARTHYKGAVKRHLQRLGGNAAVAPMAGSELVDPVRGRGVGTVVEAALTGAGRFELLAVTADDAMRDDAMAALAEGAIALDLLALPCVMI